MCPGRPLCRTPLCWSFPFLLFWCVVRYCDGSFCTHSNFCYHDHQTKFQPTPSVFTTLYVSIFSASIKLIVVVPPPEKVAMKRNLKVSSTSNFELPKIKTNSFFNFRHITIFFAKVDHHTEFSASSYDRMKMQIYSIMIIWIQHFLLILVALGHSLPCSCITSLWVMAIIKFNTNRHNLTYLPEQFNFKSLSMINWWSLISLSFVFYTIIEIHI